MREPERSVRIRTEGCSARTTSIAYGHMRMWGDKPYRSPARFAPIFVPILALLGMLALKYLVLVPEDCEHAALSNNINTAVLVCREEYLTTNDHALAEFSNGIRNVPSTVSSTTSGRCGLHRRSTAR